VKIVLNPADKHFKANIAELHDASGASEPTEYQIVFRGEIVTTRRIRFAGDNLAALSADGLHEIIMPLTEIGNVTVVWLPKQMLCIIAPNMADRTASCAILSIHPTHEAAEWHALDYLADRGFNCETTTDLLQAVRGHQQYDLVIEEI
jgi:hypothetical protein